MKRILFIEDDVLLASIYTNKFRMEGYEVVLCSEGEAGLARLKQDPPDVLILDLMLPKVNGIEIIQSARAIPALKTLPIIVFSNAYLSNLVQNAWKAGANHVLMKANCTPNMILEVVKKALAAAEAAAHPPAAPAPAPAPEAAPRAGSGSSIRAEAARAEADETFQEDLRKTFLDSLPTNMAGIRAVLHNVARAQDQDEKQLRILELYRKLRSFASNAAMIGMTEGSKVSSALEAFLRELHDKPEHINASTLRTIVHAVDFLPVLFSSKSFGGPTNLESAKVLVVDDELISRRAIVFALEKVGIKPMTMEDPRMALGFLDQNAFDLLLLDIDMPDMTGLELCKHVRANPLNAKTPVVFVTGLTDFESRAKSTLSGGSDLIGTPFLFMELGVKALVHLLKRKLALHQEG